MAAFVTTTDDARERVFRIVREAIVALPVKDRSKLTHVTMSSSIVTDLGIDSLSMIEVAVAIEDALGIAPIPLALWREREAERAGARFTVASLVDLCLGLAPREAEGRAR